MTTPLVIEEQQIDIPPDLRSLADFRHWALSDNFPDRGRIDWVARRIEVDMSPEDLFRHSTPKGKVYSVISDLVESRELGYVFIDRVRFSSVPGDVSAEPDVLFVSHEAIDSGGVRLIPKAGQAEDAFVELEGEPDLIVEIVSDSSVNKDTRRLPKAYFQAGVREFWLVDARRDELIFHIHRRGLARFEPVTPGPDGYQASTVLGLSFRLDRKRDKRGHWVYQLEKQP